MAASTPGKITGSGTVIRKADKERAAKQAAQRAKERK